MERLALQSFAGFALLDACLVHAPTPLSPVVSVLVNIYSEILQIY
jgi:hypothetical protein